MHRLRYLFVANKQTNKQTDELVSKTYPTFHLVKN